MRILDTVAGRAVQVGGHGLSALAGAAVAVALAVSPAQGQALPWAGQAPWVEAGDTDPFYNTADLVPDVPGTVLRTASVPYAPAPSGPDGHQFAVPDRVQKMMYSTTDMSGAPVAVSGYTVEPTVPWTGPGDRPTVVVGRGTVGQGDQCAPRGTGPWTTSRTPWTPGAPSPWRARTTGCSPVRASGWW